MPGAWRGSPATWPPRCTSRSPLPEPPEPPFDGDDTGGHARQRGGARRGPVPALHRPRCCSTSRVGPSPDWMARRLTLAGMRPINNVVDASNYVMLDLGQPTHPYDLDLVGGGGLRVRAARPGETRDHARRRRSAAWVSGPSASATTGATVSSATPTTSPIGIGGIMGGATSEISPSTSRVLLEAAYFAPMAIARTSKRLNLRSEASARFERGCDPEGIDRAALRLCELLGATAGEPVPQCRGCHRRAGPGARARPGAGAHGAGERRARQRPRRRPGRRVSRAHRVRVRTGVGRRHRRDRARRSGPTPSARSTSSRRWPATTGMRTCLGAGPSLPRWAA